jgi:hypothetical protein
VGPLHRNSAQNFHPSQLLITSFCVVGRHSQHKLFSSAANSGDHLAKHRPTGGNKNEGYLASKYVVIAIHAGILLSHAIINSLSISLLSFIGKLAAAWNMLGNVSTD